MDLGPKSPQTIQSLIPTIFSRDQSKILSTFVFVFEEVIMVRGRKRIEIFPSIPNIVELRRRAEPTVALTDENLFLPYSSPEGKIGVIELLDLKLPGARPKASLPNLS